MSASARVERSARRLTPPLSMISTGSAGLVELTIADASHDRVGAGLLTCGRFANFGSEFGEVVVGRFEDVTKFEFGAHRDLEQFRGWQIATLQFVVEIIWEIHLQAWHTPDYTPKREARQAPVEPQPASGGDLLGRDPVEGRPHPSVESVVDLQCWALGTGGFRPASVFKYPLFRAYVLVELGGIEPQISVWLGVDLCCLVSVSCDDAV